MQRGVLGQYSKWLIVLPSALALLSIFLIQYAGFMNLIPSSIRDAAGNRFLSSFLATFLFYLVGSLALARLTIIFWYPLAYLFLQAAIRALFPRSFKYRRIVVRIYSLYNRSYFFVSVIYGLVLFVYAYALVSNWWHHLLAMGFGLSLALLALIPPFVNAFGFSRRKDLGVRKRSARRASQRKPLLMSLIITLLVGESFVLGNMRAQRKMNSKPVAFTNSCLTTNAVVLLSNDSDFLLASEMKGGWKFYLTGPSFAVESGLTKPSSMGYREVAKADSNALSLAGCTVVPIRAVD